MLRFRNQAEDQFIPMTSSVSIPTQLDCLNAQVMPQVSNYLSARDIAALTAVNRRLYHSMHQYNASLIWRQKLSQYFPFLADKLKNQRNVNWQFEFAEAYKFYYKKLTPRQKWLFSLVSEGDVEGLKTGRSVKKPLNVFQKLISNNNDNECENIDFAPLCFDDFAIEYRVVSPITINRNLTDREDRNYRYVPHGKYEHCVSLLDHASHQKHQALLDYFYFLIQTHYSAEILQDINAPLNQSGDTLIVIAAKFNQSGDSLQALVDSGASINEPSGRSRALYWAAERGHLEFILDMLEMHNDINMMHLQYRIVCFSLLHLAAENGHLHLLTALLERGANWDVRTHLNDTPLNLAAFYGHLSCVRALAENRKNLKVQGCQRPLYEAVKGGHVNVVRYLLSHIGVDVNEIRYDGDYSALHAAVHYKRPECLKLLLEQPTVDPEILAHVSLHIEIDKMTAYSLALYYRDEPCLAVFNSYYSRSALENYWNEIKNRADDHYLSGISLFNKKITGYGLSAEQKKKAVLALKKVIAGDADVDSLKNHAAALSNGRLGVIAKNLGYHFISDKKVVLNEDVIFTAKKIG